MIDDPYSLYYFSLNIVFVSIYQRKSFSSRNLMSKYAKGHLDLLS